MSSNLPKTLLRLGTALVKAQVQRAVGDETLRTLADTLAESGQETLAERLTRYFERDDHQRALQGALARADACVQNHAETSRFRGLAQQLGLRDLPSVLDALQNLPQDDLTESRLRATLAQVLQRDWHLAAEEAQAAADLYLLCLREAVLEVEADALRTLGRSVLRTEQEVQR